MHAILLCLLSLLALPVSASTPPMYTVTIKNHQFEPATLEVPAGTKLQLIIHNADDTPEEFESNDFHREKIILGHAQAKISVGPLKAGTYRFFGEFHPDTAQGILVVKE